MGGSGKRSLPMARGIGKNAIGKLRRLRLPLPPPRLTLKGVALAGTLQTKACGLDAVARSQCFTLRADDEGAERDFLGQPPAGHRPARSVLVGTEIGRCAGILRGGHREYLLLCPRVDRRAGIDAGAEAGRA